MRLEKLIPLVILLGFLLSCDSNRPSDMTVKGDRPVIALVMKSLANEFFVNMADGAEKHQIERADYELIINGIRNESDLSQQVVLVVVCEAYRAQSWSTFQDMPTFENQMLK